MRYTRLRLGLGTVIVGSFGVLGDFGSELYRQAPPIPQRVVTADGRVLRTGEDIHEGRNVWQSMGGQAVGTVWGHGAYVAPDWSADYLHREATWLLDRWADARHHRQYQDLGAEERAALEARLKEELRRNTYDPATGDLTVSPIRAEAMAAVGAHYESLFGRDPALDKLRDAYAIPAGAIGTPERQKQMSAFFFWASWACSTNRPGAEITYTNNWPSEDLIDNHPSGQAVVWSVVSFVLLPAGSRALAWYFAVQRGHEDDGHALPAADPLLALKPTPSMGATLKYFWVVTALMVAQDRLRADHRRRVDGRPVARGAAEARQRGELPVRAPGVRVRGPRPILAVVPHRGPVPLAGDDDASDVAGLPASGHRPTPAGAATIFAVGILAPGWFVLGLKTGWSIAAAPDAVAREFPQEALGVR